MRKNLRHTEFKRLDRLQNVADTLTFLRAGVDPATSGWMHARDEHGHFGSHLQSRALPAELSKAMGGLKLWQTYRVVASEGGFSAAEADLEVRTVTVRVCMEEGESGCVAIRIHAIRETGYVYEGEQDGARTKEQES